MQPTRRQVMLGMTGMAGVLLAAKAIDTSSLLGQTRTAHPQPFPSPNAPPNQNAPVQLDQQDIPVIGPGQPIPPATWKEIKDDAMKLYQMSASFATQVANTNTAATLPLSLLKEAHEIEKMAKHIQQRMRG
jgi:hypothetical protein